MAPSQTTIDTALAHPIDLVTRFVARHDWLVRQQERDAIIAEIPGRWSDYQLAVSWQDGEETMQVVCRIDVRAEQAQVGEIALLAALLNQQLLVQQRCKKGDFTDLRLFRTDIDPADHLHRLFAILP